MNDTREHEFPLTGAINLQVRLGNGTLTVTARDDLDTARVRLTAREPDSPVLGQIAVEMRGPTLAVVSPRTGGISDLFSGGFGPGGRGARDAVDVQIEVPSGTAAKLSTTSADIVVTGRIGGGDVATGAGDVTLDTVDGDLRLRYGASTSRVEAVAGDVQLRSGAGDAHFGEVGGALHAGFGSGDLEIEIARGSVRSRAGSGDARIGCVYGDVDFGSGSGTVSVGLPAGLPARLDVTTGSGRLHTDLPIEDEPAGTGRSITVRARTGSGDVHVFRAA